MILRSIPFLSMSGKPRASSASSQRRSKALKASVSTSIPSDCWRFFAQIRLQILNMVTVTHRMVVGRVARRCLDESADSSNTLISPQHSGIPYQRQGINRTPFGTLIQKKKMLFYRLGGCPGLNQFQERKRTT